MPSNDANKCSLRKKMVWLEISRQTKVPYALRCSQRNRKPAKVSTCMQTTYLKNERKQNMWHFFEKSQQETLWENRNLTLLDFCVYVVRTYMRNQMFKYYVLCSLSHMTLLSFRIYALGLRNLATHKSQG